MTATASQQGSSNPALAWSPSAAVTIGAAPAGSTSATISAGQTAQYNLQITPGAGYTGTVSLTYTGAPPGATIQGPSTLQVSNGNAAPFMVSVTRSGGARAILPFSETPRLMRFPFLRTSPGLILAVTLLLLLAFAAKHHLTARLPRLAFSSAFTAIIFLLMLSALLVAAGCGGGSAAVTTPPQIVTPQGQSMIIVTPSATSTNGKPLQLQAIQLTLTVN